MPSNSDHTMLRNLPIIAEELVISKLTLDDLDYLYDFLNLKEIKEFIPDRYETKEELRRTLEWLIGNYGKSTNEIIRISLGIRLKEGKKLIGWVTYGPLPYDVKLKEIAYAIHPTYWNKGYATMAGKAFIKWLTENIADEDLFAQVNPKNYRSTHVLEKLGMVQVKKGMKKKGSITEELWIYKLHKHASVRSGY